MSFDFGSRLYIQLDSRMYNLLPALRTNGGGGSSQGVRVVALRTNGGGGGCRGVRVVALRTNGGGGPGYVGSRLRGNDEWVGGGNEEIGGVGVGVSRGFLLFGCLGLFVAQKRRTGGDPAGSVPTCALMFSLEWGYADCQGVLGVGLEIGSGVGAKGWLWIAAFAAMTGEGAGVDGGQAQVGKVSHAS